MPDMISGATAVNATAVGMSVLTIGAGLLEATVRTATPLAYAALGESVSPMQADDRLAGARAAGHSCRPRE
jgi:hypothetical protein